MTRRHIPNGLVYTLLWSKKSALRPVFIKSINEGIRLVATSPYGRGKTGLILEDVIPKVLVSGIMKRPYTVQSCWRRRNMGSWNSGGWSVPDFALSFGCISQIEDTSAPAILATLAVYTGNHGYMGLFEHGFSDHEELVRNMTLENSARISFESAASTIAQILDEKFPVGGHYPRRVGLGRDVE